MDSILIREKELQGRKICLAIICDGVGGLADGAYASAGTARMLGEWFDTVTDVSRIGLRMRDELLEIDRKISAIADDMHLRTGTTVSAVLLDGENYYIAHTGDSRIYHLCHGKLEQLTYDQVNNGRLTSCLGRGSVSVLFYNEGSCREGRFLLCSDGLYKRMDKLMLERELLTVERKSCRKAMLRLTQYVIDRGETDNISLAIVICES